MVLIVQENHTLAPSQIAELKSRLNAFVDSNGLSLAINGEAGDGSFFSVEMKDKQNETSIIVTSPFRPTTFVFGLYSRLPATRLARQRAMFTNAVRAATAEAPAGATSVGLIFGGTALVSSETIVGGIGFGLLSAGAFTVSTIATTVEAGANFAVGRYGNLGVNLFSLSAGKAVGFVANEVGPAIQLVRNGGAALASQAASSVCPG